MPLVAYGHAGYPLLMFPTAAADYLEYERFYLVDAIKDFIESGLIRAYSINSVNKYSLLNRESHPGWKVEMLTRYDNYIMDEVLPLIRNECGDDATPLIGRPLLEIVLPSTSLLSAPPPPITTPPPSLPKMTLPAPSALPPMIFAPALMIETPAPVFPTSSVPAEFVPRRLPRRELPVAPAPVMSTPLPALPEITLPAPEVVPPIV